MAHRAAVPGVPAGVVSQHGGVAEGVGEGQLYLQHLGQGYPGSGQVIITISRPGGSRGPGPA